MTPFNYSGTVKVLDFNPRSELFGKKLVPACDISIRIRATNHILDDLRGPAFRHAFYMAADAASTPPAQGDLEGVDPASETPLLRIEGLEPLKLKDELTGYAATFDIGTGRKESIVELGGVKVGKFSIEALQGGTVDLFLRLQASGLKERELGKLGVLIGCEVALVLEPSVSVQASLGGEAAA